MTDHRTPPGIDKASQLAESIKEEDIILITEALVPNFSHTIYSIDTSSADPSLIYSHANPPQELVWRHQLSELPSFLKLPAEDIHVVVSTKSGAEKAVDFYETVLGPVLSVVGLDEKNEYGVLKTESHESITQLAESRLKERAAKGIKQTVLLLAGDGGVVDLINGLLKVMGPRLSTYVRPTIVLFPLGTGNALFHSLQQPATTSSPDIMTVALRTLLRGTASPLPIFRATFSAGSRLLTNEGRTATPIFHDTLYGAIVASYGFHATLVADSDTASWRTHGARRFGLVAQQLLSGTPHAYRARLTLKHRKTPPGTAGTPANPTMEETTLPGLEHGYILLTLVSHLEKTFCISPASQPLDGALRVVHFGPESAETVGAIMAAAYRGGEHVDMRTEEREPRKPVAYEEVEGARIAFLERDDRESTRDTGKGTVAEEGAAVTGEESSSAAGAGGEGMEAREGRWRRVCVDGLIVRVEEGGWMEVAKVPAGDEAIDIVLPQ